MTALQDRPAPAAVKEEQPYVDPTPNRRTGLWLGIIALVGLDPLLVTLVALLVVGASVLFSGASVSGRMASLLGRS